MLEVGVVRTIGIMILAAAGCIHLLGRLRVPNLVTFIISGLLLVPAIQFINESGASPGLSPEIVSVDVVKMLAKAGIALLLFLVGLELSLQKVRDVGRVAVVAGLGQVVVTAIGGFLLAYLLGFSFSESWFIAIALTFSSTVVVVKLLDQKRDLDTLYGRISVGIFLVQDLVVIFLLTLFAGMSAGEEQSVSSILLNIFAAFGGMGLLLGVTLISAKYVLPVPFGWAARSHQTLFLWSLSWCFFLVFLAEHFSLSLEIGAFLAGMSLAQLPCSRELIRRVQPLANFFLAIFFISLGAQMDLEAALEYLGPAVAFSAFVLLGKPVLFSLLISKMGYDQRTSVLSGITVAQVSEFSLILAGTALQVGIISPPILSFIALTALITIAASSYLILYNEQIFEKLSTAGLFMSGSGVGGDASQEISPEEAGHVIVVGMNTMGRAIAEKLYSAGESVLMVDTDPAKCVGLSGRRVIGDVDSLSLLEETNFREAKLIVSCLHIAETNTLLAYRAVKYGVPIVVHAFDESAAKDIEHFPIDYVIDSKASTLSAYEGILAASSGGPAR